MPEYPRLFCLVCVSSNTVEYSSQNYSAVKALYNGLPPTLQECFEVIRYDPSPYYTKPQNER